MIDADINQAGVTGEADPGTPVDPNAVKVWRLNALGSGFLIVLISAVGAVVMSVSVRALWPLAAALLVIILVLEIIYILRYPAAYYRHLRYWVDDTGIRIQSGVFWKSLQSLPRVRIQHSDVSQGPVQRRYGVATLKLYTAGSQFTRIELDGLEYNTAVALRNQLQMNDTGDAV